MKMTVHYNRLVKLVLLSLLATCMLMFASPKEAEAQVSDYQGFEAHAGLGYLGVVNSGASHGVNFTLSAGYRWHWIGAYIDQTLGGVFANSSGAFVGSTILGGKAFYNITDSLELWGQAGVGAAYFEGWGGFGLKLGVGLSYKITESIFIGGDFAYTLAAGSVVLHFVSPSMHVRFRF